MRNIFYFLPIVWLIACSGPGDPVVIDPGRTYFVPNLSDTALVERGVDAVPETDGIYLVWFDIKSPDLRYFDIYRMQEGETYFRKIKSIDLATASPGTDTTYTDNSENLLFNVYNYYYIKAVYKDGVEGQSSDTAAYKLMPKPVLSRPSGETITGLPVFVWSFPGVIPNNYILRIEEVITNKVVFVHEFQVSEFFNEQSLDLAKVNQPPEFNNGFTYRRRVDHVGTDAITSGSESMWSTFVAN